MTRATIQTAVGILLVLVALALAACGGDSSEDAEAQACDDAATFRTALTDFTGTLQPGVTREELEQSVDEVEQAFATLRESAREAAETNLDDVERSFDDLVAAVERLPQASSLSAAVASIETPARDRQNSWEQFTSDLSCGVP